MSKHEELIVHNMKSGKYFVGDPCYAFTDDNDSWSEIAGGDNGFYGDNKYINGICINTHIAIYKGHTILGFSTYYGDGSYHDKQFNEYSVDSGCIGLVPIEVASEEFNENNPPRGMKYVEFPFDFTCQSQYGIIIIGNILIDTKGESESYEYESNEHDNDNDLTIQDEA